MGVTRVSRGRRDALRARARTYGGGKPTHWGSARPGTESRGGVLCSAARPPAAPVASHTASA
jgi:hypothetical protein